MLATLPLMGRRRTTLLALLLCWLRWMASRLSVSVIAMKIKPATGLSLQPCVPSRMLLDF